MNTQTVSLIGRILMAVIFFYSSFNKIIGPEETLALIRSSGLPFAPLAYAASVLVELSGALALVFGFQLRIVAAILAAFSVVTGLAFHNNLADQAQVYNLLKNFAMAGGLLQLVAFYQPKA